MGLPGIKIISINYDTSITLSTKNMHCHCIFCTKTNNIMYIAGSIGIIMYTSEINFSL